MGATFAITAYNLHRSASGPTLGQIIKASGWHSLNSTQAISLSPLNLYHTQVAMVVCMKQTVHATAAHVPILNFRHPLCSLDCLMIWLNPC